MILVDTSVWISHLRYGNTKLADLLNNGEAACHQFIAGELACGNLKNRNEILSLLKELYSIDITSNDEILYFIEQNRLMGRGLGLIDVHLLASAILNNIPLWTMDNKLRQAAIKLSINYSTDTTRI